MEWTNDKFLDGKVQIRQPKKGFRAGSDAVLLAASVNRSANVSVLDVGAGVGTVGICIKHRLPNASIYGIECQKVLADQALENARVNNCAEDFNILNVDIGDRKAFSGVEGPNGRSFIAGKSKIAKVVFTCDGKTYVGNNTATLAFEGNNITYKNVYTAAQGGGVQFRFKTIAITYAK